MKNYLYENLNNISLVIVLLLFIVKPGTYKFLCKSINMILEYVIILFCLLFFIILTYTFLHTVKLIHLCFTDGLKIFI